MPCITKLPSLLSGPVFIENPDGTLVEGVPPGYQEPTPSSTPRGVHAVLEAGNFPQLANADVVRVLARHEGLFLGLLLLQLVVEVSFEGMHMSNREDAVFELSLIYPSLSLGVLHGIYMLAFCGEAIYCCVYFSMGMMAACRSKPRLYQRFAAVALIGTLGQLPLAYLNRFNLLIFFLRFIAYAYARFQWNLLQGINAIEALGEANFA